jgi:hypothetical protein
LVAVFIPGELPLNELLHLIIRDGVSLLGVLEFL